MSVQFAARNAALTTIYLALDAESFKSLGHLPAARLTTTRDNRGGLTFASAKKRAGAAPRPLQVVGAGVATVERDGTVLAPVDGI